MQDNSRKGGSTPRPRVDLWRAEVYASRRLGITLRLLCYLAVGASVLAYAVRLAMLFFESVSGGALFIAVSAVPFVLVSLLRKVINAPRPYELIDIYPSAPKNKKGESFPSRHTFSIFLIATLCIPWRIYVAVTLAVLGVVLAVCRVLLGYHFVRDVVAGFAVGVISGVIGILITSFI